MLVKERSVLLRLQLLFIYTIITTAIVSWLKPDPVSDDLSALTKDIKLGALFLLRSSI